MPRRREVPKRKILPDPKYGNETVAKFCNTLMVSGKKSVAERILYKSFDFIRKKGMDPIEVFDKALYNASPILEVKSRRVGGATYQVPIEVRAERRFALSMRWLVASAKKRGEKSSYERLGSEFIDASEKKGGAVKKRDDVHRMADANKAFSHFRF